MFDHLLRRLPEFRGKHRLADFLYHKKIQSSKDILLEGKFSCKYLLPNLQENVGLDIFINGIYEPSTINFLHKLIPPGGLYMDLGANIGAILIPLCKRRPDIKSIAVEAAPWLYEYLQKNVSINKLEHVQLLNTALFDKDELELLFYSPADKFGKGSLSPVFNTAGVKVMTRKVDSIVRDSSFQKVDVLKVDVEGFEYFVFKGAEELLRSASAPHIIFEFVDWAEHSAMGLLPGAAQKFLIDNGYQLFILENELPVKIDTVIESGAHNLFASKQWL